MFKRYFKATLSLLFLGMSSGLFSQNIGINTTGTAPSTNAILDLNSGNSGSLGLIIPNVTLPATITQFSPPMAGSASAKDVGMLVYNSVSTNWPIGYYYWSGTSWINAAGAANLTTSCTAVIDSIPIFSSSSSICNSIISQTGTPTVGINTIAAKNILDVRGAMAVGSAYAGSITAPANGMVVSGQVGIGTDAPPASAVLDISSTTQGLLIPTMTTVPSSPVNGLIVYNTSTNCFEYYLASTSSWVNMACGCTSATFSGTTGAILESNPSNTSICETTTGQIFTTANISGATAYTWVVPSQVGSWSGQGSNAITVNTYTAAGTGTFSVTAGNACGQSTTTTNLAVTVYPSVAGSFSSSTYTVCPNTSYTLSISGISTYTNVTWSSTTFTNVTTTANVTTANSGSGASSLVLYSGAGGTAAVTATISSPCGSLAITCTVTCNTLPTASISGSTATPCVSSSATYTCTATGSPAPTYAWTASSTTYGGFSGSTTGSVATFTTTATAGVTTLTCTVANSCETLYPTYTVTNSGTPTSISFTNPSYECINSSATYTCNATGATTYTWTSTPATYGGFSSGPNSSVVTFTTTSTAGTTSLTCTVGNACATAAPATDVIASGLPSGGTFTNPTSQCHNTTASYTCTVTDATSYAWTIAPTTYTSTVSGQTTNVLSFKYTGASGSSTTYTLSCIATNGCGSTTYTEVVTAGNPGNNAISGPTNNPCKSSSATYTCTATTASSYAWTASPATTYGGFSGSTTGSTATYTTNATPGSFTLSCVATNGCGSATAATYNCTSISAPPAFSVGPVTAAPCLSSSTTYTCNATGTNTYVWASSNTNLTVTGTTATVTVTNDATSVTAATLSCTATSSCGGATTETTSVTTNTAPTGVSVSLSGSPACTGGNNATYTCAATNATSYTWSCSGTDITVSGSGNTGTITTDGNAVAATLSCVATNACGSTTGTLAIQSYGTPTAVIAGPAYLCEATEGTYTCTSTDASDTYSWQTSSGTHFPIVGSSVSATCTFSAYATSTTNRTITCTVTNPCGNSASVTYTVQPLTSGTDPSGSISPPTGYTHTVCESSSYTYTCVATDAGTYAWSVTPVSTYGGFSGSTAGATATFTTNASAGSFTINCTPSNTCGSGSAETYSVTSYADPTAAITESTTTPCPNTNATFTCTATNQATSGTIYQWSSSNTTYLPLSGSTTSSTCTVAVASTATTTAASGVISCTVTGKCGGTVTQTVAVTPIAAPVINAPAPPCVGTEATYSITATSPTAYHWASNSTNLALETSATAATATFSASVTSTVTATITCTVTASCGTYTVTTPVTTYSNVTITPAGTSTVSLGGTGTYTCTNISGATYTWASSNTNFATVSGSTYTSTVTGVATGTVALTCTVTGACTYTATTTITVPACAGNIMQDPNANSYATSGDGASTFTITTTDANDLVVISCQAFTDNGNFNGSVQAVIGTTTITATTYTAVNYYSSSDASGGGLAILWFDATTPGTYSITVTEGSNYSAAGTYYDNYGIALTGFCSTPGASDFQYANTASTGSSTNPLSTTLQEASTSYVIGTYTDYWATVEDGITWSGMSALDGATTNSDEADNYGFGGAAISTAAAGATISANDPGGVLGTAIILVIDIN